MTGLQGGHRVALNQDNQGERERERERKMVGKVGNVNPGLINHGLLIRIPPVVIYNLILKWYPPN